jgi:hypothetical protein
MKFWSDIPNLGILTSYVKDVLSKSVKIKIHRTVILPVVLYGYET